MTTINSAELMSKARSIFEIKALGPIWRKVDFFVSKFYAHVVAERASVLRIEWDREAVFDVSREVVNEIILKSWDRAETDFYSVNSQLKSAFDENREKEIGEGSALLTVGVRPPMEFISDQSQFPSVSVSLESIPEDGLRFVYWQKLGEISNLLKKMSPFYKLEIQNTTRLAFPSEFYAIRTEIVPAVLL